MLTIMCNEIENKPIGVVRIEIEINAIGIMCVKIENEYQYCCTYIGINNV